MTACTSQVALRQQRRLSYLRRRSILKALSWYIQVITRLTTSIKSLALSLSIALHTDGRPIRCRAVYGGTWRHQDSITKSILRLLHEQILWGHYCPRLGIYFCLIYGVMIALQWWIVIFVLGEEKKIERSNEESIFASQSGCKATRQRSDEIRPSQKVQ